MEKARANTGLVGLDVDLKLNKPQVKVVVNRDKIDAVIEASVLRLRPILMTTGAMILGAVPLAIATGAGAEGREAIGWVIVGGMGSGTLLTLFVVPVVYLLLGAEHKMAVNSE